MYTWLTSITDDPVDMHILDAHVYWLGPLIEYGQDIPYISRFILEVYFESRRCVRQVCNLSGCCVVHSQAVEEVDANFRQEVFNTF